MFGKLLRSMNEVPTGFIKPNQPSPNAGRGGATAPCTLHHTGDNTTATHSVTEAVLSRRIEKTQRRIMTYTAAWPGESPTLCFWN